MLLLFAPGAGAPSTSAWMRAWRDRFATLGSVVCVDYPYQLEGRKAPDRPSILIAAHRAALIRAHVEHPGPFVLIGKSMGSRIGCHVARETDSKPAAIVCLGYPLVGQNGALRDQVLVELANPILFVQGSRDLLCPPALLESVRGRMRAPNDLFVVEDGDHSLQLTRTSLKARRVSQEELDARAFDAIRKFISVWTQA